MKDIMVSVICTTYNHKDYIAQCLDSMLEQKTDFGFEIIVHDDCSTDGTTDIVREYERKYPNIIKAIYEEENCYSRKVQFVDKIYDKIVGKYLAHLEGDDYWCNENKLQCQYDYMEKHPKCALCFHDVYTVYVGEKRIDNTWFFWKDRNFKGEGKYTDEELLRMNVVPLSSMFYKLEDYNDRKIFDKISGYGDMIRTMCLATKGYGYCMDKRMSVYRRGVKESAMTKAYMDIAGYNESIEKVLDCIKGLDRYTRYKFTKILSEIYEENKNKCIELLINERLEGKKIYIYGTGVYGRICAGELKKMGISFCGFVVSNMQNEGEYINGNRVLSIDKVNDKMAGFIVATGKRARREIKEILNDNNFKILGEICEKGI